MPPVDRATFDGKDIEPVFLGTSLKVCSRAQAVLDAAEVEYAVEIEPLEIRAQTLKVKASAMRKRWLRFTFERESYWMVALLLIPLLVILLGIVIPGLLRRWFP
jgi:hypothetical protein